MKPIRMDCDLVEIRQRSDGNIGAEFVLKNKETKEDTLIQVDESIEWIKSRFKDLLSGEDERDGIYLSKEIKSLVVINQISNGNIGAEFILKNKDFKDDIIIQLDEDGDTFLPIKDKSDNSELDDWNWYVFSKENVENLLK